jgi:hypothetical protein
VCAGRGVCAGGGFSGCGGAGRDGAGSEVFSLLSGRVAMFGELLGAISGILATLYVKHIILVYYTYIMLD